MSKPSAVPPMPPIIPGNPYDRARYFPPRLRDTAAPPPSGITLTDVVVAEAMARQQIAERMVRLTLPYIPPRDAFPRAFEGRHWAARSGIKAKMKQDIGMLMLADPTIAATLDTVGPFQKAHVTITFRSPRGNYDADNALSASKGWIDGLVKAGILVNDTVLRVSYTVQWERHAEEETEIVIREVKLVKKGEA